MRKRKSDSDGCDRIQRKIRRLEKKLARKKRRHRDSLSADRASSSCRSSLSSRDKQDNDLMRLVEDEDVISPIVEEDRALLNPTPTCDAAQAEKPELVSSVVLIPPNDAVPSTSTTLDLTTSAEPTAIEDCFNLDNDILEILGIDPTTDKKYGKDIQKDLAIRLQHWAKYGLDKNLRKDLKDKYLTPENCKLIDPPILNAEMKAAISDSNYKRDKAIEGKQKTLTLAITCLGEAISFLLSTKDKDTNLLKLLMDSVRIVCDCQHADTITRRNFIMGGLKKEIKEQLQNTIIDKYLFGENLADTLKSAKAICKTGTELKPPTPKILNKKPIPPTSNSSRNLNWQNPGPSRRQTGPQRMKQPATTLTSNRPSGSSKQSQPHQQRPNYTRR